MPATHPIPEADLERQETLTLLHLNAYIADTRACLGLNTGRLYVDPIVGTTLERTNAIIRRRPPIHGSETMTIRRSGDMQSMSQEEIQRIQHELAEQDANSHRMLVDQRERFERQFAAERGERERLTEQLGNMSLALTRQRQQQQNDAQAAQRQAFHQLQQQQAQVQELKMENQHILERIERAKQQQQQAQSSTQAQQQSTLLQELMKQNLEITQRMTALAQRPQQQSQPQAQPVQPQPQPQPVAAATPQPISININMVQQPPPAQHQPPPPPQPVVYKNTKVINTRTTNVYTRSAHQDRPVRSSGYVEDPEIEELDDDEPEAPAPPQRLLPAPRQQQLLPPPPQQHEMLPNAEQHVFRPAPRPSWMQRAQRETPVPQPRYAHLPAPTSQPPYTFVQTQSTQQTPAQPIYPVQEQAPQQQAPLRTNTERTLLPEDVYPDEKRDWVGHEGYDEGPTQQAPGGSDPAIPAFSPPGYGTAMNLSALSQAGSAGSAQNPPRSGNSGYPDEKQGWVGREHWSG
ncbi:hypothetical protein H2203_002252 [Taxawa tesnikishii (nom. ined.)]|nr:hypothetical protein H2203_002252 [Dothideales sp. JES 119]